MQHSISIEEVSALKGAFVDWLDDDFVLFSKGNKIYKANHDLNEINLVCKVPQKLVASIFSNHRLGKRLFRQTVYNIIPVSDDFYFVSFGNQIGYIEKGSFFEIPGTEKCGRILRQGACLAPNKKIYWGSYIPNNDRNENIEIFEFDPQTKNLNIVYSYDHSTIRHVHRVTYDEHTDNLWVTTGDKPQECKLSTTSNYFEDLVVQYQEDESWRAVGLQFSNKNIYYASDCEFIPNHIYKINRISGDRIALSEINAPCYYSTSLGPDLLFASTAELCPSQTDNSACIYHVDPLSDVVTKIFEGKKDLTSDSKTYETSPLASKLFQNGIINFPSNNSKSLNFTYFSCLGLKGLDFKVFKVKKTSPIA